MRVLTGGKGSNHYPVTSTRNLAHKLLVAAPVVLTLAVAVESRTHYEPYQTTAPTELQQDRVLAYTAPVRAASALANASWTPDVAARAREAANVWIRGGDAGTLKPLLPYAYDDTMRDGVKLQVLRSAQSICNVLNEDAFREIEQKHGDAAIKDSIAAYRVMNVIKYSDFTSISMCGLIQRHSLSLMRQALATATPEGKAEILGVLKSRRPADAVLGQLAANAHSQFLEYQQRQGLDPVTIRETDRFVSAHQAFQPNSDIVAAAKELKHTWMANRGSEIPSMLSVVRLGYVSEIECQRDEALTVQLAGAVAPKGK